MGSRPIIISKNSMWTKYTTLTIVNKLVRDLVATEIKGQFKGCKLKYQGEELKQFIQTRDNQTCFFCFEKTKEIQTLYLHLKNGEQVEVNGYSCCDKCKETNNQTILLFQEDFMNQSSSFSPVVERKELIQTMKKETKKEPETILLKLKTKPIEKKKTLNVTKKKSEKKAGYRKNTCALCKEKTVMVGEQKMKNTHFCGKCLKEKRFQGLVFVKNERGIRIGITSYEEARDLSEKGKAVFLNHNNIKITNSVDAFVMEVQMKKKKWMFVSHCGKWSIQIDEKEANEIVNEGIASVIHTRTIRAIHNEKEFYDIITKRDKNICQECGEHRKFVGILSKGKIHRFSNTKTYCLECRYKLNPKMFLKWLNIRELKGTVERTHKVEGVWLYEKEKDKKHYISKEDAQRLEKEGMAVKKNEEEYLTLYTQTEFRDMILKRDHYICTYCGEKGYTLEHILPKSREGITVPNNCACACLKCNEEKNNMTKEEYLEFKAKKKNEKTLVYH